MIRRLLARLFRRPPEIRREATMLVAMHGAQGAWFKARSRRHAAAVVGQLIDEASLLRRRRYWNDVMREIEHQTGYEHQPDTATRKLDK